VAAMLPVIFVLQGVSKGVAAIFGSPPLGRGLRPVPPKLKK